VKDALLCWVLSHIVVHVLCSQGFARIAVQDFDGDGVLDIAVAGRDEGFLRVHFYESGSAFTRVDVGRITGEIYAIGAGLLNNNVDALGDILVSGPSSIHAFFGSADRSFTTRTIANINPATNLSNDYHKWTVKIADIDNDGINDILALYGQQGVRWIKQSGQGVFQQPPRTLVAVDLPSTLEFGDFNNDRVLDFAVHSDGDQRIYAFYGTLVPAPVPVPGSVPVPVPAPVLVIVPVPVPAPAPAPVSGPVVVPVPVPVGGPAPVVVPVPGPAPVVVPVPVSGPVVVPVPAPAPVVVPVPAPAPVVVPVPGPAPVVVPVPVSGPVVVPVPGPAPVVVPVPVAGPAPVVVPVPRPAPVPMPVPVPVPVPAPVVVPVPVAGPAPVVVPVPAPAPVPAPVPVPVPTITMREECPTASQNEHVCLQLNELCNVSETVDAVCCCGFYCDGFLCARIFPPDDEKDDLKLGDEEDDLDRGGEDRHNRLLRGE